jgi:hypothetical protein
MKDINTSIKQSNSLLSTSQMERCTWYSRSVLKPLKLWL